MKKAKLIFVAAMSVLFTFMCFVNSTFSWFDRPLEKQGSRFSWTENAYSVSTGKEVSINTYASSDDGDTYGSTPITSANGTLSPGEKKCFRTDITNLGGVNQSVSLFLSGMKSSANFSTYVGVNGPMRTHKPFASKSEASYAVRSDIYKRNVYMGLHSDSAEMASLTPKKPGIHYWDYNGMDSTVEWANCISTGGIGEWDVGGGFWNGSKQKFNMYSATIDSRATHMQLVYTNGGKQYGSDVDISNLNSNNTLVFFEYGGNYHIQEKYAGNDSGARIETYYSKAMVDKGGSIDIPATGRSGIRYSTSNASVATVNTNTGVVSGVNPGTAKITATSEGVFGDIITAECEITVRDTTSVSDTIDDVPVVTNLLVEKTVDDAEPSVQSVYWYIRNESYSNVTYSFSKISLTL